MLISYPVPNQIKGMFYSALLPPWKFKKGFLMKPFDETQMKSITFDQNNNAIDFFHKIVIKRDFWP